MIKAKNLFLLTFSFLVFSLSFYLFILFFSFDLKKREVNLIFKEIPNAVSYKVNLIYNIEKVGMTNEEVDINSDGSVNYILPRGRIRDIRFNFPLESELVFARIRDRWYYPPMQLINEKNDIVKFKNYKVYIFNVDKIYQDINFPFEKKWKIFYWIIVGLILIILMSLNLLKRYLKRIAESRVARVILIKLDEVAALLSRNKVIKFDRYSVAFVLFVMFFFSLSVALRLHYSSIAGFNNHVPYDSEVRTGGVVFGGVKWIRGDEWIVASTSTLANYPHFGAALSFKEHVVKLLSPSNWGYYLFGREIGFSFMWNFYLWGSMLAFFLLSMLVTKNNFSSSVLASLFIFFSSYNRWWGINGEVALTSALIFTVICFIYSSTIRGVLISSVVFIFLASEYFKSLYPAWQVPLVYGGVFIIAGIILRDTKLFADSLKSRLSIKVSFVVLGIIGAVIVGLFYWQSQKEYFNIVLNTEYPGRRFCTGGDMGPEMLFSGYYDFIQSGGIFFAGNICESSSFIFLFPIILLLLFIKMIQQKKLDFFLIFVAIYLMGMTYYILNKVPAWFAQYSLLSFVPSSRAQIGLGFVNALMVGLLFSVDIFSNLNVIKKRVIFACSFISVFVLVVYWGNKVDAYFGILEYWHIFLAAVMFALFAAFYFINKKLIAATILLSLLIIPSIGKNPVTRGVGAIYDKTLIIKTMELYKKSPNALWLVYGDTVMANYIKASGVRMFNGVQFPPDLKRMSLFDPEGKYKYIYNRYAHIVANPYPPTNGYFKIKLPQAPDTYIFSALPGDNLLRRCGVKYYVVPNKTNFVDISKLLTSDIKSITTRPLNGYWILEDISVSNH